MANQTPKKEPYTPRYADKLNKHYDDNDIMALADDLYDWITKYTDKVFLGEFFQQKDKMISNERVMRFKKKSEYFAEMHRLCVDIQNERLNYLGMFKKYETNPNFIIFAKKNVGGWRDNPETDDDNDDDNNLSFEGWT